VPEGLTLRIARHARGGLRDALSLLDQLITFGDGSPSLEDFERLSGRLPPELLHALALAVLGGDTAAALGASAQALERGARPADLLDQLTELLQGLLVTAAGGQPADRTDAERAALAGLAADADLDRLAAMLDVLVEAARRLRQRHDGRLVVDLAVVNLARMHALRPLSELLGDSPGSASVASPPPSPRATSPAARPAAPASRPAPGASAFQGRARPPVAEPDAGGGSAPVTPRAPSGGSGADTFAARFIAAASRGSRSLRAELTRYASIRIDGDAVVLVPPPGGAGVVFDPTDASLRKTLEAAALEVSGRKLAVRVERGGPAAGPVAREASTAGDGLEQRMREDWPGAERVDI
jgi:DNA polymerase-3 subunit gamma/tau